MPGPELSVVIPARDEEAFLPCALASCAAQTVPVEIVVVDNASRDRTTEVAASFSGARIVREPVIGRARAKNAGARAARGGVLLFLDADSRMLPDLAERILARSHAGERAGDVRIVADSRDPLDRVFFALIDLKRLFEIRAQMAFVDRETFLAFAGFDVSLELGEDKDLLDRIRRAGIRVSHVSESWIATSPRRLHALPLRLGLVTTFSRWALAHAGIGRRWRY